jgi:anti-sigma regulatory factor (Ser/Thr protein kinase)
MTNAMSRTRESWFRVQGGPRAAGEARSALSAELADHLPEDRLRDVQLVVTEIVNNSVLHGRVAEDGWISIDVSLADAVLHVAVRDSGVQGEPRKRDPDYENGGGFGLFLVDAVASDWGVEHDHGLTVWFHLGLDGTA